MEKLLAEILKEMRFHGKLLEEIVFLLDEKKKDCKKAGGLKPEIIGQITKTLEDFKGINPATDMMLGIFKKQMGEENHGN